MMAVRTTLTASDLPDNLHAIRTAIEAAVPHGRTDEGGANDRGAWGDVPDDVQQTFASIKSGLDAIVGRNGKIERAANKAIKSCRKFESCRPDH